MKSRRLLYLAFLLVPFLINCEGCKKEALDPPLKLPFYDNFDRPKLGDLWYTEAPGRWWIEYSSTKRDGRLCAEQAQNLPLFLKRTLPDEVVVEFDAWAEESEGDVKIEIFTDGRFHATGYVLIHGGWHNRFSIIDRLDEHNKDRRWVRGGPVKGRKYHWKVVRRLERDKKTGRLIGILEWFLDGKLFLSYLDRQPLLGQSHKYFAFSNWNARICFDNLKIYAYRRPETKASKNSTQPTAKSPIQKSADQKPADRTPPPAPSNDNSSQVENSESSDATTSPPQKQTAPPPARRQLVLDPRLKLQRPLQLQLPILKLKTPIDKRNPKPTLNLNLKTKDNSNSSSGSGGN